MTRHKIALFGGSFDPVHCGHRDVIAHIIGSNRYQECWVIPCAMSPGKPNPLLSNEERLALLLAVVEKISGVKTLSLEIEKEGLSYTIDTIETLQAQFSECEFEFWMGMDQFKQLASWHRYQDVVQRVTVCVYNRETTYSRDQILRLHAHNPKMNFSKLRVETIRAPALSSSLIRQKLLEKQSVQGLVPRQTLSKLREIFPSINMPIVTGVSGRAGSGKTSYSKKMASENGATLIELDKIGHMALGVADIKKACINAFSSRILTENGDIDRRILGEIVFQDHVKLARLNAIIHPCIKVTALEMIKNSRTKDVWMEGALIEEIGLLECCDTYIVMTCSDEISQKRSHRDLSAILKNQRSQAQYEQASDQTIASDKA